jgi:hypothetical protein
MMQPPQLVKLVINDDQSPSIEGWLDRVHDGDESARAALLESGSAVLGVSERTLGWRWATARLNFHWALGRNLPGS